MVPFLLWVTKGTMKPISKIIPKAAGLIPKTKLLSKNKGDWLSWRDRPMSAWPGKNKNGTKKNNSKRRKMKREKLKASDV